MAGRYFSPSFFSYSHSPWILHQEVASSAPGFFTFMSEYPV